MMISILIGSCSGDNAPECLKKSGEIRDFEFMLEPFNHIVALDEIDIHLLNGSEQKVVLRAGQNIRSGIEFNVKDEVLTITNENSCNWMRNSGNPELYITGKFIKEIEAYDYVNIFADDTLETEKLRIYSDGTGNIDLKIDTDTLKIYSIFISNYQLEGKAKFMKIYMNNDGKISARNLHCGYVLADHYGSNTMEVFPVDRLRGKLMGTGDILYYHCPEEIKMTITGPGKLIDLSE